MCHFRSSLSVDLAEYNGVRRSTYFAYLSLRLVPAQACRLSSQRLTHIVAHIRWGGVYWGYLPSGFK
jgi:hypothetical protein